MTAQGNALGNKSATMTNALKGRNKMFNPKMVANLSPFQGLRDSCRMVPRALPWAYMLRPRWGKSFALQADRAPPDVSRTPVQLTRAGPVDVPR